MTDERTPRPPVVPDGMVITTAGEVVRLGVTWRTNSNTSKLREHFEACLLDETTIVFATSPPVMATIEVEHLKVLVDEANKRSGFTDVEQAAWRDAHDAAQVAIAEATR